MQHVAHRKSDEVAQARLEERGAIVKWLRSQADENDRINAPPDIGKELRACANLIVAGEHHEELS